MLDRDLSSEQRGTAPYYLSTSFLEDSFVGKTWKTSHALRIETTRSKGLDLCYSGHLIRTYGNKRINDKIPALILNISVICSRTWYKFWGGNTLETPN